MKDKVWSIRYYELFFDIFNSGLKYYKIDISPFNFNVKREANFKHFSLLKKCLDSDINSFYFLNFNREPTEEEYYKDVRNYFRRGFCYCYHWTYEVKLIPVFTYSPLTLYTKYNLIKNFKVIKENKNTFIKR